ncbi:leukocyte surface antigen CD53-like [Spodoptera litura]|uniref:Tetraspanin n=1 Tax=Spodoptera litura TaxID=69820 RepID=A0A9J7E9I1_SPOLT|nr:leukocyte surface antigen CD53-like [Spodoptera litura]
MDQSEQTQTFLRRKVNEVRMCCLAEFIVKYVLIIVNIVFALAGLAIIGLGTAVHVNLSDFYQIIDIRVLTISVIVLGCIVFVIAFCACCGAIRESKCMLGFYAACMAILAALKIYITVVIFSFLGHTMETISRWLDTAFRNTDLEPVFNGMEILFQCCGTNGTSSYTAAGRLIPVSCCPNPNAQNPPPCDSANAYGGCTDKLSDYFDTFGEAIGGVLIVVIIVECVCVIFGLFMCCQIRARRN